MEPMAKSKRERGKERQVGGLICIRKMGQGAGKGEGKGQRRGERICKIH